MLSLKLDQDQFDQELQVAWSHWIWYVKKFENLARLLCRALVSLSIPCVDLANGSLDRS